MPSGTAGVWLMTVLLTLVAGILFLTIQLDLKAFPTAVSIPWWVLAIAFFFSEVFVVHLEFRSSAHSFALSEIPLVAGLFFASPAELLVAQLVGAGLALLLVRRQKTLKALFNLALLASNVVLINLIFRAIVGTSDVMSARGWVGTLVGLIGTNLLSVTLIVVAIALVDRGFERDAFLRILSIGFIVTVTNGCLALLGVQIVDANVAAAWLLVVPAATLFIAYKGYSVQRQKLSSLEFLYQATRVSQSTRQSEVVMLSLLSQARAMFAAEISEIILFPAVAGDKAQRTALGPGDEVTELHDIDLDPTTGVWARVASEGEALLLKQPIPNLQLRKHFEDLGMKDAMVAPLRTENGVVGTMTIANHMGDVSTFDIDDLHLLETLVNHASVWLENARLIDRLEESLAHLTEMNRLKDDFVATVSHELRTPLTSIQGYIKTLLRPEVEFDADERRSFLEVIDRQSARLRALIEDLLVVSRLESHDQPPNVDVISLPEIVAEVLEELEDEDASRVETDLPERLPRIVSDASKMMQVLANLVGNALKYSEVDAPVKVKAEVEGRGITVSVTDKGGGVPDEFAERVFDRFFQVDQSNTRTAGGTGLGLYISRRFAEAIGARVWLESSSDSGSTFCVWIPLEPPVEHPVDSALAVEVDP